MSLYGISFREQQILLQQPAVEGSDNLSVDESTVQTPENAPPQEWKVPEPPSLYGGPTCLSDEKLKAVHEALIADGEKELAEELCTTFEYETRVEAKPKARIETENIAVTKLIEGYHAHMDKPQVQEKIVEQLVREYSDNWDVDGTHKNDIHQLCISASKSEYPGVRAATLPYLAENEPATFVDLLINEPVSFVRAQARYQLAEVSNNTSIAPFLPTLTWILVNGDDEQKHQVILAINQINIHDPSLDDVRHLLKVTADSTDNSENIRELATEQNKDFQRRKRWNRVHSGPLSPFWGMAAGADLGAHTKQGNMTVGSHLIVNVGGHTDSSDMGGIGIGGLFGFTSRHIEPTGRDKSLAGLGRRQNVTDYVGAKAGLSFNLPFVLLEGGMTALYNVDDRQWSPGAELSVQGLIPPFINIGAWLGTNDVRGGENGGIFVGGTLGLAFGSGLWN